MHSKGVEASLYAYNSRV